jgi:hypothetical protein
MTESRTGRKLNEAVMTTHLPEVTHHHCGEPSGQSPWITPDLQRCITISMAESLPFLGSRTAPTMPLCTPNADSRQKLPRSMFQLSSLNMPCDSLSCIILNKAFGAVSCVARIVTRYIYRQLAKSMLQEAGKWKAYLLLRIRL